MAREIDPEESFPWYLGVYDAHCHPTDTLSSRKDIPGMKARVLTIMATRGQDQHLVAEFADHFGLAHKLEGGEGGDDGKETTGCRLIPSFGWHPWFSHLIYDDMTVDNKHSLQRPEKVNHYKSVTTPSPEDHDFMLSLPDPRPLSDYLAETRNYLTIYPYALVGEIGIDRAFRIPEVRLPDDPSAKESELTPGGREGRRLSPYRVNIDHQRKILTAQLNLAGEMQRPVSVHGVSAHGLVYETLHATWQGYEKKMLSKRARKKGVSAVAADENDDRFDAEMQSEQPCALTPKPFPPRVCLHSYSGPPDTLKQYLHQSVPTTIYFSFSRVINFSTSSTKAVDVINAVPGDRLLVESDLHCAGPQMDDLLEGIVRSVCQIRGWSLEDGVKQLASNWVRFIFGEEGSLRHPAV